MNMKNRSSQKGFTLVELIVVIIILGILAAVALPKFMDVTSQAHQAAVDGATGGLGAGVALAHAQWVANGNTAADTDVTGFGDGLVDANDEGWPVSAAANAADLSSTTHCSEVWTGVMQNPPTLGASPNDYTVTVSSGAAAGESETCTYTYNHEAGRSITYNAETGAVTSTNP